MTCYTEHKAMVKEFQETFHQPVGLSLGEFMDKRNGLRQNLLKEEQAELLDAMADIAYIALGTAVECDGREKAGYIHYMRIRDLATQYFGDYTTFNEAFKRVHENNMDKIENGLPLVNGVTVPLDKSKPKGKILKREGWVAPDLSDLVE